MKAFLIELVKKGRKPVAWVVIGAGLAGGANVAYYHRHDHAALHALVGIARSDATWKPMADRTLKLLVADYEQRTGKKIE